METYSKTTLGMSMWDTTTQREITKSSRRELSNIKIKTNFNIKDGKYRMLGPYIMLLLMT